MKKGKRAEMRRKVTKKVLAAIFIIYIIYLLLSCIFVPIFQKKDNTDELKQHITSADTPSAGTERILCIDDNVDALAWRLAVIEDAKKELILSTFDFGDDNSGKDMVAALYHAAERGVHIRILVDGIYGTFSLTDNQEFHALIALDNVEAKLYNPINLALPWKANYRMHDKYIIADNKIYMLGGRNTTDLFLGNYRDSQNIDRDILVYEEKDSEGASIYQLQQYFEQVWALSCNQSMKSRFNNDGVIADLQKRYEELKAIYPNAFTKVDWTKETIPADNISLLYNPIGCSSKEPELWEALCRLMQNGKDIVFQTP